MHIILFTCMEAIFFNIYIHNRIPMLQKRNWKTGGNSGDSTKDVDGETHFGCSQHGREG